jgi:hypothetical protein
LKISHYAHNVKLPACRQRQRRLTTGESATRRVVDR